MLNLSATNKRTFVVTGGFSLVLLILIILATYFQFSAKKAVEKRIAEVAAAKSQRESVFAEKLKPIYTNPKRVQVDSIKIDINVGPVSVAEDGSLEVPKNWNEGGWYRKASKPGEEGNLIINAHYDDNFGRPAAFWSLNKVKDGDLIKVIDDFGKTYAYKVTETFYLDINDPNRLDIFDGVDGQTHITLITCGGVWDPRAGTYNKRFVVKGDLYAPEEPTINEGDIDENGQTDREEDSQNNPVEN